MILRLKTLTQLKECICIFLISDPRQLKPDPLI